jgi:hypothetical protein
MLKTISFVQDKLLTAPSDSSSSGPSAYWLFKNKEHGNPVPRLVWYYTVFFLFVTRYLVKLKLSTNIEKNHCFRE